MSAIKRIPVDLGPRAYDIMAGVDILKGAPRPFKKLNIGTDAVIVTHPLIERLHGAKLLSPLRKAGFTVKIFNVPEGERSKSAGTAMKLIEQIAAYDVNRNMFLVALGGGVIGDLCGFVAAIYKRGVPYIQCPTTFLAQIDSAIGGKTAIDLQYGKNLVGAIYQPRLVLADTTVLATLSARQIRNGLAEAIKYGVIADAALFRLLERRLGAIIKGQAADVTAVVERCARIKADIVAKDEKETKGLRTLLNFGHTVGHAVEAAGRYDQYQHGEAVALGMRVAARISQQLNMLSSQDEQRINALLTAVALPERIAGLKMATILERMRYDKKFSAGKNRFVLASRIGKAQVVDNVPWDIVHAAIQSFFA